MLEYGFQPQVDFNSYKKVQVQLEGNREIGYGFDTNSDFRLVTQKRATNNPKNPYTIGTDYRAITQKRVTAQ